MRALRRNPDPEPPRFGRGFEEPRRSGSLVMTAYEVELAIYMLSGLDPDHYAHPDAKALIMKARAEKAHPHARLRVIPS